MTAPKHDGWDCLMHVKYVEAAHYDTALNRIAQLEAALKRREQYPRSGAYGEGATCKHGDHPYECRSGCDPHDVE